MPRQKGQKIKQSASPGGAPINSKVRASTKTQIIRAPRATREESNLANMLADPCNAPLIHGSYPGVRGYLTRVSKFLTVTTGPTDTGFIAVIFPQTNNSIMQNFTTTATPTAYSVAQTLVGGSTFLTNSAQTRSVGACLQVWSNQAPLNVTGNISWGTVPIGNFPATTNSTGTFTADFLLTQACQHHAKMTADTLEVKWRPGSMDHYYEATNTGPLLGTAAGDQNAIVVVAFGLPVNTTYTLRSVNIVEWQPSAASGLNMNIQSPASSPVAPTQTVAKLDRAKSNWWYAFGKAEAFVSRTGDLLDHAMRLRSGMSQ